VSIPLGVCFLFTVSILTFPSAYAGERTLESFRYREDFSSGELNAWASYPPNQDTAYDPYVYPGNIRPDDGNTCLIARNDPLWHADRLVGAVKRLNFVFDRSSTIRFRCYIKTVDRCSGLTVRLPLETGGRLEYTLKEPALNRWNDITLDRDDFTAGNDTDVSGGEYPVTAIIIEAAVPGADPDVPIYFGLDDIEVSGKREAFFTFIRPKTALLAEWPEHIALGHFRPGDTLRIAGLCPAAPDEVSVTVTTFVTRDETVFSGKLALAGGEWRHEGVLLDDDRFPPGFYRGVVTGNKSGDTVCETPFVFLVEPPAARNGHPRLLCDPAEFGRIRERFMSDRFRPVRDNIVAEAASYREKLDPSSLVYDTDQFPEKDWIATLPAWSGDRIRASREALHANALCYGLLDDREAGEYCRSLLIKLASWPQWNHPWMENRGFHTYYPLGEFAVSYALAYDLVYDLLTESERRSVREALLDNFIFPAYETYIVDDQVTSNSSNWICHIVGGALFSIAAALGDDSDDETLEPMLSGCLLKMYRYIETSFGRDGSYGEGFRYFNFAMQSFATTLPAVERLFGVDLAGPLEQAHLETLWASNIRKNYAFTFGDSEPFLKRETTATWIASQNGPMNSWAWLLEKKRDPLLAWLYHHLKEFDTIREVLHETSDITVGRPDTLGCVKFFRDVGTAVFRSGWKEDDFVFVFRSGPFYNHQHMDQGSFFLSDHGSVFLEERYDGDHHYYDDPVYRTHAIQAISHNTILLDRNPMSQKVGDPAGFAPGMTDHAEFAEWFDSERFAFAAGDLEGVYRGRVEKIRRNVLFIKPRTILLVDEITPAADDVEVNLLFHTRWKKDILIHDDCIVFDKEGSELHLYPVAPEHVEWEKVSEPHFKVQYDTRPLVERGYLMLSRRTAGKKLVMANLLTATKDGEPSGITMVKRNGNNGVEGIEGSVSAVIGDSGDPIVSGSFSSDGVILSRDDTEGTVFMAGGTYVAVHERPVLRNESPFTAAFRRDGGVLTASVFLTGETELHIAWDSAPRSVMLDGAPVTDFRYDGREKELCLRVGAGFSILSIR